MNEHDSKKRYLGEFYTPLNFAEKSLSYIFSIIDKKELDSGKYRIWDMACGTGNLEYYLDEKYHKYLYMSTIDKNDIDYSKEKFKNACMFQYDYLNDDINDNNFEYNKLPQTLKDDLNNKNIKWIILINPPYATSQVAGTNSKSKKNVSASKIRDMMHKEKLGDASRELYSQFMFRIHKEFQDKNKVYLAIFSKTNYIKYNNNEKFRNKVCNYKFISGFIFSSVNFDNTSKTTPFPVSFIIWEINNKHNIKTENIILDVLDNNCNLINKKSYNVIDSDNLLNKWIKRVKTSSTFVPLSSAIKVKTSGKDIRDKICEGFIGSLMSCGSDLQKQNLTAVFSAPQASAGSLSITKENFEKAMIIHAVRRTAKVDWLNGSDQFCIPQNELDRKFILDCVIWTLFSTSNQTSAMDNIFYKEKYYTIINHFYPFDYKKVYCGCTFFKYNNEKRFCFEYLEKNNQHISNEAFELINTSERLYKYFYSNIEKVNKEKFKISLWDSGFWQIRKSLKDAKLASDILKEIKIKRNILKNNISKNTNYFVF
ncbi:hypothetical protein OFR41_07700 [Brachyspira hyodysenteriae]|uniref:hypothetical protein n=1 Tax=Brachyspira hyodysenteriae TaxID=159 RepID=UPI00063D889F|nr:hypothetical protein [Brachyspira hyodysenteriae]KLI49694.1 hypothetical protein SZ41_05800 [Brachyspira hyodysenteriae]KLI53414.1 hypothetical protein SZ43_06245 [Brachyspira hyodysenteriae]MDA0034994.1 hypothetical protein [Brachyspira hyodysenteriae]MDA0049076.1 hypothetical protein [Brachyspira hyodysenteriae]MDA0054784.1 hypothetical protein [Brachyspira hyodysenteriae]